MDQVIIDDWMNREVTRAFNTPILVDVRKNVPTNYQVLFVSVLPSFKWKETKVLCIMTYPDYIRRGYSGKLLKKIDKIEKTITSIKYKSDYNVIYYDIVKYIDELIDGNLIYFMTFNMKRKNWGIEPSTITTFKNIYTFIMSKKFVNEKLKSITNKIDKINENTKISSINDIIVDISIIKYYFDLNGIIPSNYLISTFSLRKSITDEYLYLRKKDTNHDFLIKYLKLLVSRLNKKIDRIYNDDIDITSISSICYRFITLYSKAIE